MGRGASDAVMAIIPVKLLAEAKQRLSAALDRAAREQLTLQLLERTLSVLARVGGLARVVVVSRDQEVLAVARARGAWAIWETGSGLNSALEQATRVVMANGARAVLVLPADLPELAASEVQELLRRRDPAPGVVIAPAARDGGTNALLVNPGGLIAYAFGPASFQEHCRRANQAGARLDVVRAPGLEFDLDLAEELERLQHREE